MKRRFLSMLLVFVMVLSLVPSSTLAYGLTPAESPTVKTATVHLTTQGAGAFLCEPQKEIAVRGDLAESYGYTDTIKPTEGVSALDVLVMAHQVVFGEEVFTKDDASTMLALSSSGWVTTVFGENTGNFSFAINGAMPIDKKTTYPAGYGVPESYASKLVNEAQVNDGDNVEFFLYQSEDALDYYTWFSKDGQRVDQLHVKTDETVELTLNGYMYAFYGAAVNEKLRDGKAIVDSGDCEDLHIAKINGMNTEAFSPAVTVNEDGELSLHFATAGTYYITVLSDDYTDVIMPVLKVEVESPHVPTALSVKYEGTQTMPNSTDLIGKEGDTFQFCAYDENGNKTPVTWKVQYNGSIDENGLYTAGSLSYGSTSFLYVTATSQLDPSVKTEQKYTLCGYAFSIYQKEMSVTLSADGQTKKTASISGGVSGHNIWSYDEKAIEGIAKLQRDPGNGSGISFDILRPGIFNVAVLLDFDKSMTDTATVTVNGVAVEDSQGTQGKTYLTMDSTHPAPAVQLTAYTEKDRTVTGWSSSNEDVAVVSSTGLVTAKGVGTALITAADDKGNKGGMKVVIQSAETPYFEALEFMSSALTGWVAGTTFKATETVYDLPIKTYSTSTLTLQSTTLYDSEKYTAVAEYTDINGEKQAVEINSGKQTSLPNQPFDASTLTITLADKNDPNNKTVYTFHVTRPRDTTKTIKNTSGIAIIPDGRSLLSTTYNGSAEGTMFVADASGIATTSKGISASKYYYRTTLLNGTRVFTLSLNGNTAYTHLRYSADDGETWIEVGQSGGVTEKLSIPAGQETLKVQVQVLDDKTYTDNTKNGKDGFADAEPTTYTVWVESVEANSATAVITAATTENGDWYPSFRDDTTTYVIAVPNGTKTLPMTITVSEGASVAVGSKTVVANEDGSYIVEVKPSASIITVTSPDGKISNKYSFSLRVKAKYDVPDKVTDYLCINSQYTNGGTGLGPESTLAGSLRSLGNFGGYITYYYEQPLTDNPNNKYGMDFYVYGNAYKDTSTSTKHSFFEPGQVWVSEDGESWYALAGSAHYDDGVDWNYSVTYTKTANGKTAWTDSHGNSNNGSSYVGAWPNSDQYYMNDLSKADSITLSGIMLPASNGKSAVSGEAVDAYAVNWGYVDALVNGTIGSDQNPYLDNSNSDQPTSGFDLAWAVDMDGTPIDVSGKAFHYVKVQVASNIWHTSFGEKSTEVTQMNRTVPQEMPVGKTTSPASVTLTDGISTKTVELKPNQQSYDVDLGNMKYVSVSINGANEEDNLYINNQRVTGEQAAKVIVTKDHVKLVRILVQNGDKEPAIFLLKLQSSAAPDSPLIQAVKIINKNDVSYATMNDGAYIVSVNADTQNIQIAPVVPQDTQLTINGEPISDSYALKEGVNTFAVEARLDDDTVQNVSVIVTRAQAKPTTGKIKVSFTLLGDEKHGMSTESSGTHTYADGNLTTWLEKKEYTVDAPATVADLMAIVFAQEEVSSQGLTENYISSVKGLAAFDNGTKSGWMYMLNGKYTDKGIGEQTLRDGDEIIFHYTDDYSKEFQVNDGVSEGDLLVAQNLAKAYEETAAYLLEQLNNKNACTFGAEWVILGLARDGKLSKETIDTYYANVEEYVKGHINDKEQLDGRKASENARLILALTAVGKDVTSVAGHNLLAGFTDLQYLQNQGVNGLIWALIALDSHGYDIPENCTFTREELVDAILAMQQPDGGWSLDKKSDADMTAMGIQALAPYYNTNDRVKNAIDNALDCLSEMQLGNGGFASWNTVNAESCAQVVVALTALGIDPNKDDRFVRGNSTVLSALSSFAVNGGGFAHTETERNQMASEQSFYALVALNRLRNSMNTLYDMSDVVITKDLVNGIPVMDLAEAVKDKTEISVRSGDSIITLSAEVIKKLTEMAPDAKLKIETKDLHESELSALERMTVSKLEGAMILEITAWLIEDGKEPINVHELGGNVTISVPYIKEVPAGKRLVTYYVDSNGKQSDAIATIWNENVATFTTNHFSLYVIAQTGDSTSPNTGDSVSSNTGDSMSPNTGDDSHIVLFVGMAIISFAGLSCFGQRRKKNR